MSALARGLAPASYTVSEPLEIEPGVVLPAGRYLGTMEQHGYVTHEEVDWAKPSYSMELSASERALNRDLGTTVSTEYCAELITYYKAL